jgi:uncharacterized protein YcbX
MRVGHVRSVHRYPVKSMGGESLVAARVELDGLLGDRAFALRDEQAGEIRGAKKLPRLMQCTARFVAEPTRAEVPAAVIRLPDGTETRTDAPGVAGVLSEFLSRPVTLHPRRPASDKQHYRRAVPGAAVAGWLARSGTMRKAVAKIAATRLSGADLRRDFGREAGEPMPDLSGFPAEIFEYVSPPGTYFDAFPIHVLTTASLRALEAQYPGGDWNVRRFRPNFVIETSDAVRGFVEAGWSGRVLRVGELELECTMGTPRCSMVMQEQPGLPKDTRILRTIVNEAAQTVGIYAKVRKVGEVRVGAAVELL